MRCLFLGFVLAVVGYCGITSAQSAAPRPADAKINNPNNTEPAANRQGGNPAGNQPSATNRSGATPADSNRSATNAPDAASSQGTKQSDQQIAAVVYGCCHNEIEIAKLGQSKAQSPEVKQFAEKMIREHTPGHEALKSLAGNMVAVHGGNADHARTGTTTANAPARTNAAAPANSEPRFSDEVARGTGGSGGLNWVGILQQVSKECLASTKQELNSKQGAEFDQCFMGQQVASHMKMVDELKVLRQHATGELKGKLDEAHQMATSHLQEAKQIAEQLKDRPSERVSRKPE